MVRDVENVKKLKIGEKKKIGIEQLAKYGDPLKPATQYTSLRYLHIREYFFPFFFLYFYFSHNKLVNFSHTLVRRP